MGNKMLIDAAHPEETRVVVARNNNRIEELDYEAAARKQLRGNIYLAKVTRVEPSLQAAFVDYGGNRHGFLAFNEIHPDYYQIPIADRQALLEQEAAEDRAEEESEDSGAGGNGRRAKKARRSKAPVDSPDDDDGDVLAADAEGEEADEDGSGAAGNDDQVESMGAGDAMEDVPVRKAPRRRAYKIQEVIKRRQIILVQVVKEERGNKGAALTTYLSLAGRYCVLMPNTARGGGISRKITDAQDRKRLKDVAKTANVPDGMGLIVRTAGANRTKAEIKRDFDYLLRLWENVRDLTLQSTAPCLVYEEGSLIKRAIRDLYTKDIDSIVVEGDEGYKEAKDFMRMLMPSHARHIKAYKDTQPLFMRYSIENQLDVLFSPYVNLPSGGYIVINQTEALVSIDVNSGKATREHNIEDTALKTNMEASEEIARQMRLRDLAGLIVIDFIDMEERRNNRSVERRLKDRLKSDRARIQIGRISHFGLLEMSRQRMRSGVLESSTRPCPACEGRGFIRSVQSAALQVLRGLEDHLQRASKENLVVQAPRDVALYILNQKRDHVLQIEATAGIRVFVEADDSLLNSEFSIERASARLGDAAGSAAVIQVDSPFVDGAEADSEDDGEARPKKRRRKRGRRGSKQARRDDERADGEGDGDGEDAEELRVAGDDEDDASDRPRERRPKRGSRGGRRRKSRNGRGDADDAVSAESKASEDAPEAGADEPAPNADDANPRPDADAEAKPKRRSRSKPKAKPKEEAAPADEMADAAPEPAAEEAAADEDESHPARGNGHDADDSYAPEADRQREPATARGEADDEESVPEPEPLAVAEPPAQEEEPAGPPRRGWWQRR